MNIYSGQYPSICRLMKFMLAFGINRFEVVGASDSSISATVGWPDEGQDDYDANEEIQDISWSIQSLPGLDDGLLLLEWIVRNGRLHGDKINCSIEELQRMGPLSARRFELGLKSLLEFKVDMIDEGRKTDLFFLHF